MGDALIGNRCFFSGFTPDWKHPADRQTELLYFSLITLSTIGYSDIVPLSMEARILAALDGAIGVLDIAITVAQLVGRFRSELSD